MPTAREVRLAQAEATALAAKGESLDSKYTGMFQGELREAYKEAYEAERENFKEESVDTPALLVGVGLGLIGLF